MIPTVEQLMNTQVPKLSVPGIRYDRIQPRPYQLIDAAFAIMYPRVIIAEYPGAGKKLITMLAAGKLFDLMKASNVLIISLGADVDQWVEDLQMFTEFTAQVYRGTPKERRSSLNNDVDFRVTTYPTAAADLEYLLGQFDIIVMDEVSYLKNPETDAHHHIRTLTAPSLEEQARDLAVLWEFTDLKAIDREYMDAVAKKPKIPPEKRLPRPYPGSRVAGKPPRWVWGLSATPYETIPLDIFSLFWCIQGNASPFGTDTDAFKEDYCRIRKFKITTEKKIKCSDGRFRYARLPVEKIMGTKPEMLPVMKQKLTNSYIRHPWDTVSPYLPPLTVLPLWVDLTSRQKARYTEITEGKLVTDFVHQHTGRKIEDRQVSYAIKLFYQMRCCDGLGSLPNQQYSDSAKLTRCMSLLTSELAGEKVVVFSRFHAPLDELEVKLNYEQITFTRLDGNVVDDLEFTRRRQDFMDPDGPQICLITEKARYALNLHIARYGIAYNTLYNPKKLEQLHGRTRRGESKERRFWYHLLCRDTSEEGQWVTLREREAEFGELFGQDEEFFNLLTPSEQAEIVHFGLGAKAA